MSISSDDYFLRIEAVKNLVEVNGAIDSLHVKKWLIDQMMRTLLKDAYPDWVQNWEYNAECPEAPYRWETGKAPTT